MQRKKTGSMYPNGNVLPVNFFAAAVSSLLQAYGPVGAEIAPAAPPLELPSRGEGILEL